MQATSTSLPLHRFGVQNPCQTSNPTAAPHHTNQAPSSHRSPAVPYTRTHPSIHPIGLTVHLPSPKRIILTPLHRPPRLQQPSTYLGTNSTTWGAHPRKRRRTRVHTYVTCRAAPERRLDQVDASGQPNHHAMHARGAGGVWGICNCCRRGRFACSFSAVQPARALHGAAVVVAPRVRLSVACRWVGKGVGCSCRVVTCWKYILRCTVMADWMMLMGYDWVGCGMLIDLSEHVVLGLQSALLYSELSGGCRKFWELQ